MEMQEMMVLPQAMSQAHQSKLNQLSSMKNMPYQAASQGDGAIVSQKVGEFTNEVDSYVNDLMGAGINSLDPTGMRNLSERYQQTKMYADAATARAGQYAKLQEDLDEMVKKDPTQRDWASQLLQANARIMEYTPMDLDEKTGAYNSFNFIPVVNRPDIAKKLEDSLERVKAGEITSAPRQAMFENITLDGNGKQQLTRTPVPGLLAYDQVKSKEAGDLLAAIQEVALDPEVAAYLQTYSAINPSKDGEDITGLSGDNYFLNFNEDGELEVDQRGDPVFNTNTLFGVMAHKAFQGHNNPEITTHYTTAPSGARSSGSSGGTGFLGQDYTITSEPVKINPLGQNEPQIQYNNYVEKRKMADGLTVTTQSMQKEIDEMRKGWVTAAAANEGYRAIFGIGQNGYNQGQFQLDTQKFLKTLGSLESFQNLSDKSFLDRVAANRDELEQKGIPKQYIDGVLKIKNYGQLEKLANMSARNGEDLKMLGTVQAEINAWEKSLEKSNPVYADKLKTFETEVDGLIGFYTQVLRQSPAFRDDYFAENISNEEALKVLQDLRKDMLNIPFIAAKHYGDGNVNFEEARREIDNLLTEKYQHVIKSGGAPMNVLTMLSQDVFTMLGTPIDAFQDIYYKVADMFGGDFRRGGEDVMETGQNIPRPEQQLGVFSDRKALYEIRRSVEDLADIIGKEGGAVNSHVPKNTTLLHVQSITSAGKPFANALGVLEGFPVTNLENLMTADGSMRTLKETIADITGFDNPIFKPSDVVLTPAITTSDRGGAFELMFVVDGVIHKQGSSEVSEIPAIPIKLSTSSIGDNEVVAVEQYLLDAWMDANNNPTYQDGEARDAMNRYFGQHSMYAANQAKLYQGMTDPNTQSFEISLDYKPPMMNSQRPLYKETARFERMNDGGPYKWNVYFSSNPNVPVELSTFEEAMETMGKKLGLLSAAYLSSTQPYNYAQ